MKFKLAPIKNQKFDIGRTINFTKCDCEKCDFIHCPKNNYAVRMKQVKYSVEDFVKETRDDIKKAGSVYKYLNSFDGLSDFMDSCVGGFPKGTYWNQSGYSLELVTRNRGKYGPDFETRAEIYLDSTFSVYYYTGCTNTQEKFAQRLQKKFKKLVELFEEI